MVDYDTIKGLLHFDPVSVVIVVACAAVIWTKLRTSVKWHTTWIQKHDQECDDHKKDLAKILADVQKNQGILTTLADAQSHRLERLENWRDKQ